MEMGVKLSLSYPSVRATEPVGDKPATQSVEISRTSDISESQIVTDIEAVRGAVSEIEKFLSSTRRNLQFSTDEESGKIVVRIIASDTGMLIRQLPSEEALRIAQGLADVSSILVDAKA